MKPNIYTASDYAGFEAGRIKAYYGYEQVDPVSEEWMCVIWKNGKVVFEATNSQLLDVSFGESPESLLLAGLALYLSR